MQYHEYTCDEGVDYGDSCAGEQANKSGWPGDEGESEGHVATSNDEPSSFCGDAGQTPPPAPGEPPVLPVPSPTSPPIATPAVTEPAPAVGPTLTEEPINVPTPDAAPTEETPPPAEPAPAVTPPPAEPAPAPKPKPSPAADAQSDTHGESLGVRRGRRNAEQQRQVSAPVAVASYSAPAERVARVAKVQTHRAASAETSGVARKPAAPKPQSRTTPPASTGRPSAPVREAQRPQPPGAPLASTSEPTRDWFAVMLLAAFGLALVALAVAAVSEADGVAVLIRARSRVGSKGLSSGRVLFGDKARKSRGISYRD